MSHNKTRHHRHSRESTVALHGRGNAGKELKLPAPWECGVHAGSSYNKAMLSPRGGRETLYHSAGRDSSAPLPKMYDGTGREGGGLVHVSSGEALHASASAPHLRRGRIQRSATAGPSAFREARARAYQQQQQQRDSTSASESEGTPELEVLQCLGKGGMASVYLGRYKDPASTESFEVALKVFERKALEADRMQFERAAREYTILMRLRHPNILRMHAKAVSDTQFILVMELLGTPDAFALLRDGVLGVGTRACEELTRTIMQKVAAALVYMHANDVAHRDLKAENIMTDARGEKVKLIDFGLATETQANVTHDTMCGTIGYMSPEMMNPEMRYYGPEVDTWSFAVVVYVFLFGAFPFGDPRRKDITRFDIQQILATKELAFPARPPHIAERDYISPAAREFLRFVFVKDPFVRPTMARVAEHTWLRGAGAAGAETPFCPPGRNRSGSLMNRKK